MSGYLIDATNACRCLQWLCKPGWTNGPYLVLSLVADEREVNQADLFPVLEDGANRPKLEMGLSFLIRNLCFSLCLYNRNLRIRFAFLLYIHSALHLLNLVTIFPPQHRVFILPLFFFPYTVTRYKTLPTILRKLLLKFQLCPVSTRSL